MSGHLVETQATRGRRQLDGTYRAKNVGRRAQDGSVLDQVVGDYATASAWRDPSCALGLCWRPEFLRMVPKTMRYCGKHGRAVLPSEDPYPLEGDEWAAAELEAWTELAPRYGVPFGYLGASLESRRVTPALTVGRAYHAGDGDLSCRGVMLEAGSGAGKTYTLHAVLRALAIDSASSGSADDIRMITFPQLSRLLLNPVTRDETLAGCCEADEWICDDLGSGFSKRGGFVTSCIEEIVIHREARLYPMLAATNLKPEEFRQLFGPRVFDRLRGPWGAWINVDGPSLRQKRRTSR